ncbi:hypothetical protein J2T57_003686 [Natronocella acetinitrilica]|uniref:Uncharacterized protein n=1 Tax=Natronocella acetinitrilica TaxID=414046 RepID=A0AAE3G603_9GAMM|nr:hypothetical protein [Natronocella acetinitrilica]MCP1676525.1 hypothetical protein [Natronocella acetinitrilica]
MYDWEGQDPEDLDELLRNRNPLRNRMILFTASPWPEAARIRMACFAEATELAQFLARMEPWRHELPPTDVLELRDKLRAALVPASVTGLTDALRDACNCATAPRMGVVWWGSLDKLKQSEEAWPLQLRKAFHGDDRGEPIDNRGTRDFLAQLNEQYCR